jgi:hypothetical protein
MGKSAGKESQQFFDKIFEILATSTSVVSVIQIRCTNIKNKVDLYSRCACDATSNTIVAIEKRYYCEIIAFLSCRYYRF